MKTFEHFKSAVASIGGTVYFVGGTVRDQIMQIPSNDIDCEIFRVPVEAMRELANQIELSNGSAKEVGMDFPVWKVKFEGDENEYDFALPRRERRISDKHNGFEITVHPEMSVEDAARRRDFTINAIYINAHNYSMEDPFGGLNDIQNGILRRVSNRFFEDSLRVLRGVQFAARFNFSFHMQTATDCASIAGSFERLSHERIWGEIKKLVEAPHFDAGIKALIDCGWIACFPFLLKMRATQQSPDHHAEGNVLNHTILVKSEMDLLIEEFKILDNQKATMLRLSAIFHDIGKPDAFQVQADGRITFHGHENIGAREMLDDALNSFGVPKKFHEQIRGMVRHHMIRPVSDVNSGSARRFLRKISDHGLTIYDMMLMMTADSRGRLKKGQSVSDRATPTYIAKIMSTLSDMHMQKELAPINKDILNGHELKELGLSGRQIGTAKKTLTALVDEGEIKNKEEAIQLVKDAFKMLKKSLT